MLCHCDENTIGDFCATAWGTLHCLCPLAQGWHLFLEDGKYHNSCSPPLCKVNKRTSSVRSRAVGRLADGLFHNSPSLAGTALFEDTISRIGNAPGSDWSDKGQTLRPLEMRIERCSIPAVGEKQLWQRPWQARPAWLRPTSWGAARKPQKRRIARVGYLAL